MVSVVIPARDESENIIKALRELHTYFDREFPYSYETIVTDDGSQDGTAKAARNSLPEFSSLTVSSHLAPSGKSKALMSGIDLASASWIATMDADGQNKPMDVLRLILTAFRAENEPRPILAIGVRERRAQSKIGNFAPALVMRRRKFDSACGITVFRHHTYNRLPKFDNMHRFMPTLYLVHGEIVITLAVNDRPRSSGRSHYGTRKRAAHSLHDLIGVHWLSRRLLS